jgi:predicted oxidoreductase
MQRVQIADGLSNSRFQMGMLRLPDFKMSDCELADFFEKLIELGITTFDHGDYYGNFECETIFGRVMAIRPGLRKRIEINTKLGNIGRYCGAVVVGRHYDTSYRHIIRACEDSLKRLQIGTIDTLMLHRIDHLADLGEIARAFEELQAKGKVRSFGVSNFLPVHLDALRSVFPEIVVNQLRFSCYDVTNFENGSAFYAMQHKIALAAYSPVAKGMIFNDQSPKSVRLLSALNQIKLETNAPSLDSVCYAFLLAHPADIMPIVGSTNFTRIKNALAAVECPLSRPQWYKIYEAATGDVMP